MSDYDDYDEVEREMEAARAADRSRTRGVSRAVAPKLGETTSVCAKCGVETERLALDPVRGGRVICTGRFEPGPDGRPARIDCYDKLDREIADRNGEAYAKTRNMIREAKTANRALNAEECAYLVGEYGKQSAMETINALEARAQRVREGGGKGGRKAGLDGV